MRVLWADSGPEGATFDGAFVSFRHAHSFPKPFRPGGVPLHIGGHSEAAARRAGRLGDGSQPLGLAADEHTLRVSQMREAAEQAGRDPDAVELSVSGYLPTTTEEEVAAAEAAGMGRMLVSTSMSQDLDGLSDEISAFADGSAPCRDRTGTVRRAGRGRALRRSPSGTRRPSTPSTARLRRSVHPGRRALGARSPVATGAPTVRRAGRDRLERIPTGLARYHATRHAVLGAGLRGGRRTATGVVGGVAHHLGAVRTRAVPPGRPGGGSTPSGTSATSTTTSGPADGGCWPVGPSTCGPSRSGGSTASGPGRS